MGGLKRKVLVLRAVIYCWMPRLMGGGWCECWPGWCPPPIKIDSGSAANQEAAAEGDSWGVRAAAWPHCGGRECHWIAPVTVVTDSATRGAIVAPSPALALGSIFHTQAKGVSNGGKHRICKSCEGPGCHETVRCCKIWLWAAVSIIFTVGRSFKQHQH